MNWQDHLAAAEGFQELGMHQEANYELDRMRAEDRSRPEVYALRLQVYLELRKWDLAEVCAKHLSKVWPDQPGWRCAWAACRRRQGDDTEAEAILLEGRDEHPGNGMIFYGLACLACARGDTTRAKVMLATAIDYTPEVRELAIDDEELAPIWDEIGRMG